MNVLKRAMSGTRIDMQNVYSDGNEYWEHGRIPYMGTYIPTASSYGGSASYDWESYFQDDVNIKNPNYLAGLNRNRGISDASLYNHMFGIPRGNFDLNLCDVLAINPYVVLFVSIVCNYLRSVEYDLTDKSGERVDYGYERLDHPNPQATSLWDELIPAVRDLLIYDQAIIVKTFTAGGWLDSFKAYRGPEFWAEIDKMFFKGAANPFGNGSGSYLSHGYITRWWQHTASGLFIPYKPDEVVRLMMYPTAGNIYGTDILKYFRFHFKGLMSGTIVFGKMMDNGLVTNLVFKHPDIQSREVLKKRLDGVNTENTGSSNYGKTLHLIGNEDVMTVSNKLVDMQYIEAQKFMITIVANAFGLPASEFSLDGGGSRTTAYKDKDIRNTRMLATLLTLLENKINKEIVPHIRGYQKGWKFQFKKLTNLDDELKQAYVTQQNMSSLMMAMQLGVPFDIGMKLTNFGGYLTSEERDRCMEMALQMNGTVQMQGTSGRYDGDDYNSTFMGYKEVDSTMNQIGAQNTP